MAAQRLDRAGLAGEPRVQDGVLLEQAGDLPEDRRVDVDVLEILGGAALGGRVGPEDPRTEDARGGLLDGGHEARAVRVVRTAGDVVAREERHAHPRRRDEVARVAHVRHLDVDLAPRVGGQVLADRGDRGQRGLVAGEQERVRARRRAELDAADGTVERRVRAEQDERRADLGGQGPARGGTGVAVQHDVHDDLARLGAHRDGRVGAQRVAALLGLVAPRGVPGLGVAHEVLVAAVGRGQDELDPHVEAGVAEEVELRAGEREPAEAGRELLDARHLDVEEAPRRGGAGDGTTSAGAGCGDGLAHTGEANLRTLGGVNPSGPRIRPRHGETRHAPRPRLRHSR